MQNPMMYNPAATGKYYINRVALSIEAGYFSMEEGFPIMTSINYEKAIDSSRFSIGGSLLLFKVRV